jgi:ribonuclease HII
VKTFPNFDIETQVLAELLDGAVIVGVDEAGRGPLCGPVVAAAVVIPAKTQLFAGINDSKKMTQSQRVAAYEWIVGNCAVGIGQCSPAEIDGLNILHASMLAMKRAVANLPRPADFVLVDGNRMPPGIIGRAVVKGDSKSISIAAASIVAKETRDKIMRRLGTEYPEYGWDKNAGYPTQAHLRAIKEFGINQYYRKSFKPVKDLL